MRGEWHSRLAVTGFRLTVHAKEDVWRNDKDQNAIGKDHDKGHACLDEVVELEASGQSNQTEDPSKDKVVRLVASVGLESSTTVGQECLWNKKFKK